MSNISQDAFGRTITSLEPDISAPPRRQPDAINIAKVTMLGSVKGQVFIEHAGREWTLRGAAESPLDLSLAEGDLVISKPRYVTDGDRQLQMGSTYAIASPVETGTFERLSAPKGTSSKAMRPVDALSVLAPLKRVEPTIVQLGVPRDRDLVRAVGEPDENIQRVHDLQPVPHAATTRARAAAVGVEAIIQRLSEAGVTLRVTKTHRLVVKAQGGRLVQTWRDVIDAAAPLLLAHLSGEPELCDLEHKGTPPPAVTVGAGGVHGAFLCAQHASGELE